MICDNKEEHNAILERWWTLLNTALLTKSNQKHAHTHTHNASAKQKNSQHQKPKNTVQSNLNHRRHPLLTVELRQNAVCGVKLLTILKKIKHIQGSSGFKEQQEKGMHGNTKDARKCSGPAVLLVMPGWRIKSLGWFPEPFFRSYCYCISFRWQNMPCSSLKRKRWHEPTSSAPESFFQNYPSYSVRRASSLNAADDGVTFVRPDAKGMLQSSKSTQRRRHCATLSFEDKWTVPLCPKTLSQPKQMHTWLGYLRAMTLSLSKCLNEMKRLRMGVDPCLKQPAEVLLLKSNHVHLQYLCRELCRCVGELPSFKVVQVTSISVPIESNSSPWLLRLLHSSSSSHSMHAKELWMGASDASDSDPSSLGSVSQSSQVTSSWVLLDSAILFKGTRAATDLTADHDADMIQFLFDLAACFAHGKKHFKIFLNFKLSSHAVWETEIPRKSGISASTYAYQHSDQLMSWFNACKSANEMNLVSSLLLQPPITSDSYCLSVCCFLCLRRLFQELQQFLWQLRRYLQISFGGSWGWQLRCRRSWSLTWSSGSTCRAKACDQDASPSYNFNDFQHLSVSV